MIVLMRAKLQGVHINADNDQVACLRTGTHQRLVTTMQCTHRWHKANRFPLFTCVLQLFLQLACCLHFDHFLSPPYTANQPVSFVVYVWASSGNARCFTSVT